MSSHKQFSSNSNTKIINYWNLDEFKSISDVIVVNRMNDELNDVKDIVYTRDIYRKD